VLNQTHQYLSNRRLPMALTGLAAGLFLTVGSLGTGCSSDPESFVIVGSGSSSSGSGGSGSGVGAGGDGAQIQADKAEQMFHELEQELMDACAECHAVGGIADTPFLGDTETGDPTPYAAISSWPGIIVKDPAVSTLITWPKTGVHTGGENPADLEAKLLAWLQEEAKAVADVGTDPVPTVPPFKPIVPGFNAVYLDSLGNEYAGMAVTFTANELTDEALALTALEIHTTSKRGLHIGHPLFNVFEAGSSEPSPDPVDSFSNVEVDYEPGTSGPLGPGQVILTNWVPGGKLSIAFEELSTIDPSGQGGNGGGGGGGIISGALQSFVDNAVGPLGNCTGCHGGNNGGATAAVDMQELGANNDEACGQIRNRVNLANAAGSQLFITTDPNGVASHPFKFGGDANAHQNFVNAVSVWITAEGNAQ
jgi:mono/diheme cytochrome c family protein